MLIGRVVIMRKHLVRVVQNEFECDAYKTWLCVKGFLFLFSKSERDFIAHRQSMNSCSSCFPWFEFCLDLTGESLSWHQ